MKEITITLVICLGFAFMGHMMDAHGQTAPVPSWVFNVFTWYEQGQITKDDFNNLMTWLINNNIINPQNYHEIINALPNTQGSITFSQSNSTQIIFGISNATQMAFSTSNSTQMNFSGVSNATMVSAAIQAQSTTLNSNQNITPSMPTAQSISMDWYNGNITDQQYVAQLQSMLNSGQIAPYTADGIKLNQSGYPIPSVLKDSAGFYASNEISESDWRNQVLAALFHLGLLHNP